MKDIKTEGWLETQIDHKLQLFKTEFIKQFNSFDKKSIRVLSLHHEINEDIDYEQEDWEENTWETVDLYRLGYCTQAEYDYFKEKGIKPKTLWIEIPTDNPDEIFFGEPYKTEKYDNLWNKSYKSEQNFSKFLRCFILSKVALLIKNDEETKSYLNDNTEFVINIDYSYHKPTFETEIPSLDIKKAIIEELSSSKENQELLISLWETEISNLGYSFLSELKMV